MSRKVIMIGLLVVSAVAMFGTDANAQFFDGSGWVGFSALTGTIDLRGVPKPDAKPTIVRVDACLNQIEILCLNPNGRSVAPGSASQRLALDHPIEGEEVADNGQATVMVSFNLGNAENSINCNNRWTVVPNSAGVTDMSVKLEVFRCTGDPKTDPDPCRSPDGKTLTIEPKPRDTLNQHCTLDPVGRNLDGTTQPNQVMTCEEVASQTCQ